MQKKYLPFIISSCVFLCAQSHAAQPLPLQRMSFVQLQQLFPLVLPNMKLSSTPASNALQWVKQHTDEHRVTHTRMQQIYAGFPVFGGYAIFHSTHPLSASGVLSEMRMNGVLYQDLSSELGVPDASFVAEAGAVLQQFKASYIGTISDDQVVPMVYIDETNHAFWAYKVSFLLSHEDRIPERPTAILDAKTRKPLMQWNALKTARSLVRGVGFGGNHLTGMYQFGKDLPFLSVTRNSLSSRCSMENREVKVIDMNHQYSGSHFPMSFPCRFNQLLSTGAYWTGYQSDGYDRTNGAYSASNDALYAGQMIRNMYLEWYGQDVLTWHNQSLPLVLRVHYGKDYENAYWDGQQMTFGDGASMMYPLVSLGIAAHEISHGFTEQYAGLEYFGQSGGLNESFSDMAAQAAEFYSQGKNSWAIGAEVMKENSGYKALRFMDEPNRDGKSIARADQYHENMDVHFSSGVFNRLFYILANQPGWDIKKAFHVMLKANMDYWTPYSTFAEAGCGILNAATDLGFPVNDVQVALDNVVVNYGGCLS